jgi:hypothetical protein
MARLALHHPAVAARATPSTRAGDGAAEVVPSARQVGLGWITVALLLFTFAVSLYLIQVSTVATSGYELQRLESERDGWRARNEQLEFELAKRQSLPWVEAQAVQRLGMARSDAPVYLAVAAAPARSQASARGGARPTDDSVAPVIAEPRREQSRPEPGNPGVALETIRAWLSALQER